LLDSLHPAAQEAGEALAEFAELVKRPGDMHTYKITPLTVWNAMSAGVDGASIAERLVAYSRYELPAVIEDGLSTWTGRFGQLRLIRDGERLLLAGEADERLESVLREGALRGLLAETPPPGGPWVVDAQARGALKQELLRMGYPVSDRAGYRAGEALQVQLRERGSAGTAFQLRDYQEQALQLFRRDGAVQGGSGVLVLPCGAGKTIIGLAALASLGCATLILTSNTTSVQQWRRELLEKTTLVEAEVGVYAGRQRQVRPVTVATYQMMTHRASGQSDYPHMRLFRERDWGLIIYDEVHLLPAPVFRMTAELQATRRLGLTATLVREDGCAEDVFSLIGPKRYELPWKALEARGGLAELACHEVRVPLCDSRRQAYAEAAARLRLRIASENPAKLAVLEQLLRRHEGQQRLVIGQYLDQLRAAARRLHAPLITGETSQEERERLFAAFRRGQIATLVVSKVANFAVDLPDAAVAVQISGSFGSRQEEAQRIGRILRPKRDDNRAWFYSLVTEGTKETEFARRRQLFMVEQGYRYELLHEQQQPTVEREQATARHRAQEARA